jgi:hypothetical protein
MPYQATVLRVMIASPKDVDDEREIIRAVIHEWNAVNSAKRQLVLLPVGWETHSSPQMGEPPQAIINRQVLEACDILIAVFWTRLGSPTGSFPSGTVEEVKRHIANGKEAMIYFSSRPISPEKLNPEQFQNVVRFKEECKAEGLIQEYGSLEEFRATVSRQLAINLWESKVPEVSEVAETETHGGRLSFDATRLLVNASRDRTGAIIKTQTFGGIQIQTNDMNFVERSAPREEAKWIAVIEELENEGLLQDRVGKGEVYFVTNNGFMRVANFISDTAQDPRPASQQTESDSKRKMLKILGMKGQVITLRQMWPESHRTLNGPVRGVSEAIVRNCDEDIVYLEILGSGSNKSLPLPKVTIAYDDDRHRSALEWLP